MTKEALLLQENAINSIINALNAKNEVTFKAPTGSGKTIMMAKVMDKMLDTDKNLIFFVSSLSKSELAQQNDKVFQE
jgi:type III restriction enzyme